MTLMVLLCEAGRPPGDAGHWYRGGKAGLHRSMVKRFCKVKMRGKKFLWWLSRQGRGRGEFGVFYLTP